MTERERERVHTWQFMSEETEKNSGRAAKKREPERKKLNDLHC
jgi:hypothetical protein